MGIWLEPYKKCLQLRELKIWEYEIGGLLYFPTLYIETY